MFGIGGEGRWHQPTLAALFRTLTGDEREPPDAFAQLIETRSRTHASYARLYADLIRILETRARTRFGKAFEDTSPEQRDQVLRTLLREFAHADNVSPLRRRLRLHGDALEQLTPQPSRRRFRQQVVREFLELYYRGDTAWRLVGYDGHPGHPVEEVSLTQVTRLRLRGSGALLELADGTFETLGRTQLDAYGAKPPDELTLKRGRQTAVLTTRAKRQWPELRARQLRTPARASGTSPERREFQCIVVGSGPVGAAAASTLVAAGLEVAMLESGDQPDEDRFRLMAKSLDDGIGWEFEPWRYESRGDDLCLDTFAIRKVGGSSLAWGAVSPRFLENDFRLRSRYGVGVDWPLSYAELAGDYLRAEHFMGVSGNDDNPFLRREAPFPMEGFPLSDSDLLAREACEKIGIQLHSVPTARNTRPYHGRSRCLNYALCRACPIGAMYSSEQTVRALLERPNFRLFTRAHVGKLRTRDGKIEAVRYHDAEGRECELRTERVVLAAQAIENVRILLNSADQQAPHGLANGSKTLGRFLTDHMKFYMMGRVAKRLSPHRRGYETGGSQQFQDHPNRGAYSGGRIVVRENSGPTPLQIALGSGRWGSALRDEIRETFGHFVTLGAFMEQLPYESNRVELSDRVKNEFGDPAPRIRFKLMRSYERRGYRTMKRRLRQIFGAMGATHIRVVMQPSIAGHYMCAHRMGNDPATSVVRPSLETHDVENLYLAGSGSFATGGVSNPTLTGVALAIRMARGITASLDATGRRGSPGPAA